METEKVLAPLFEHQDRALPDVIYICPFHLYQQIHSLFSLNQLELVFRHEIKSHDSSLCLERLSQLLCTIRLSNFFSFCSSASSIQTMQIIFSLALLTHSTNLRCPLSPSFIVFLQPILIPSLKKLFWSSLTPISNSHHTTCCHILWCNLLASSFVQNYIPSYLTGP